MLTIARPYAIAAAALASFVLAAPASAQSVSTRPELTLSQIESRLSGQGFRVLEIERDDGHYEVKAFDNAGACVELDVNRRTGDILRTKSDDDCATGGRSQHSSNHRSGGDDHGGRRGRGER
jgi:hypothetical protein